MGSPILAVQAPASHQYQSSAFLPWLLRGGGEALLYLLFSCGSPAKPCPRPSLPFLPLVHLLGLWSGPGRSALTGLPHLGVWSGPGWSTLIGPSLSSLFQHLHFPMWQVVPYSRVFSHSFPSTCSALEGEQALSSPSSWFPRSSTAQSKCLLMSGWFFPAED